MLKLKLRTLILTCPMSFSSFFGFLCSFSWGVRGLYFSLSAGDIEFLWKINQINQIN
jgi:hypothetical protein